MKIAIDARMYGPKITGIGNYVKNLTDKLFEIDNENEYIMLMNKPAYSEFQPPTEKVKKVKVNTHWYTWQEQLPLGIQYNKIKADIFHFPHFNVPITFRKKFVVTVHDITPKFFPGPKVRKSPLRKLGYNLVFNSALRRAAKIIAVSNHTKNQIIKHFKIAPEKIQVVYNGLTPTFQPVTNYVIIKELKNKYQISRPFIFYTGVWRNHKNLPGLLKAFSLLRKHYNLDLQLVLGGNNKNQDSKINQVLKELNLGNSLVTPGFISEPNLSTFYSAAAITVIPSFHEGFGFLALESLACGTPVVASNTTSVPEILGDAALYFNPHHPQEIAEVIAKVLKNQSLQIELVARGREVIKKYSWQKCAQQTLNIYSSY